MSNLQSSGRGGAGNIRDKQQNIPVQPEDLQTPTLKTAVVTTGRGGTGNMAKNTDPVETRLRQDVEPVVRRSSQGHVGRGGAGNVFVPGSEEAVAAQAALDKADSALADENKSGWAEKGKNLLFGKK